MITYLQQVAFGRNDGLYRHRSALPGIRGIDGERVLDNALQPLLHEGCPYYHYNLESEKGKL